MTKRSKQPTSDVESDFPPLSARELAELKRQMADIRDPTRYVIVSPFSRRFCLYYLPESGNYIMNEIPAEALFKRKAEAEAVANVLERGRPKRVHGKRMPRSLRVIAVKKTKGGVRILNEVADPWEKGKRWKPVLRRRRDSAPKQ
jgi:hypothetical protein